MTDRPQHPAASLGAAPIAAAGTAGHIAIAPAWAPSIERRQDAVTAAAAAALHDLLDASGEPPALGARLPVLWHWLAFLPRAAQHALGTDGHPRTGHFLPPAGRMRRMIAGGHVTVPTALAVGEELTRSARVTGVRDKNGSSGSLRFVTVEAAVTGPSGASLLDTSDIVYRWPHPGEANSANPSPTPPGRSRAPAPEHSSWDWGREIAVDPTLLFRFSALTYNAHRIHYDRDYAIRVEGYPGLVVHGPLQAILLAELVRAHCAAGAVTSFAFRAQAAAYDDGPLQLRGRLRPHQDDTAATDVELAAFDHHGTCTMTAIAMVLPSPDSAPEPARRPEESAWCR